MAEGVQLSVLEQDLRQAEDRVWEVLKELYWRPNERLVELIGELTNTDSKVVECTIVHWIEYEREEAVNDHCYDGLPAKRSRMTVKQIAELN